MREEAGIVPEQRHCWPVVLRSEGNRFQNPNVVVSRFGVSPKSTESHPGEYAGQEGEEDGWTEDPQLI
jgi:hypothetical protein